MILTFVSEPLQPEKESFDPLRMAQGEPGLPQKFRWREQEFMITEVLEQWKEYDDCKHGSGEQYVRKHGYRLRTNQGSVWRVYFQRTFGRSKSNKSASSRWWLHSVENT